MIKPLLAIHAGAGNIVITAANRKKIDERLEALRTILQMANQELQQGATALDVVQHTVMELENNLHFNAGRGSVLTAAGDVEMDAAIVDGKNTRAGAVAAVRRVKNPIMAARWVMEKSPHLFMVGPSADVFSAEQGLVLEEPNYFIVPERVTQWQRAQSSGQVEDIDALGTVGAVARDVNGNLAAATSTGGKANQLPGRVGDSPIIGAGTWADNETCAISGTGDGEIFIRSVFAHTIHTQVMLGKTLADACDFALEQVAKFKGEGGCIAIAKIGNPQVKFNTAGMFRAWVDSANQIRAEI